MKNVTMCKRTIVAIAAATMAMSAMAGALTVSAEISTTATSTTSTADALQKVKYTNTSVDVRQTYNAATATVTYSVSGDFAVNANGELTMYFADVDTDAVAEGVVKSVKCTVKSGSTTSSIIFTDDEDLEDKDAGVIYYDDFAKLFTDDGENRITFDVKEFPDSLATLYKQNKNLEVATVPTKTGMLWTIPDTGWDIRKAKAIDSIAVTIELEQQTTNPATKKDLSNIGNIFEDATLNIFGDIREYSVANNNLYIAAKYDENVTPAVLPDSLQSKIDNMKDLGCYLDFENYITDMATTDVGDSVITFTNTADAIADYVNNGLVVKAYHEKMLDLTDATDTTDGSAGSGSPDTNADHPNIYWYDGAVMSAADALTDMTTKNSNGINGINNAYDVSTGPLDIRDAANRTAFATVVRTAKSGSTGPLNDYIVDCGYATIVKDTEYGFVESSDYTFIQNFSTLNTALNNIAKSIAETKQLANVVLNNHNGIDNSIKTAAKSEVRPLMLESNTWTNIGMLYTGQTGMPVLTQLNSVIGENKGCKLIVNVEPTTVETKVNNNAGAFNVNSALGAARLRVNGAFALTYNDMASYDPTNKTYTFDWDAVANGKTANVAAPMAIWSLEMATYNPVGINSIVVSVPEQKAYLEAIGADETTNTDTNKGGSLGVGEGREDETENLEDVPADTIADLTPEFTETETKTDNSDVTVNNSDNTTTATNNKDANNKDADNPDTGDTGLLAKVISAVSACAVGALGCVKRRRDR